MKKIMFQKLVLEGIVVILSVLVWHCRIDDAPKDIQKLVLDFTNRINDIAEEEYS